MMTERAARVGPIHEHLDSYERRHDISGEERTSRTLLKVIIAQTYILLITGAALSTGLPCRRLDV